MPPIKGTTAKPSVSIIGSGRLGGAFSIALSNLQYPVLALVARHARKAEKALQTIIRKNPRAVALTPSNLEQLPVTKLIIISTPDDAILETVDRLAKTKANSGRGRTVLHTSGALSSSVLAPLAKVGFHTGSIHPLISSSEPATGARAFRGAFFCVEGDRQAKALATEDRKGSKRHELLRPLKQEGALPCVRRNGFATSGCTLRPRNKCWLIVDLAGGMHERFYCRLLRAPWKT